MVIVKVFAAGENREERIRKALQAFLLPGKTPPPEKMPEIYPLEAPGFQPAKKASIEKSRGQGNVDCEQG